MCSRQWNTGNKFILYSVLQARIYPWNLFRAGFVLFQKILVREPPTNELLPTIHALSAVTAQVTECHDTILQARDKESDDGYYDDEAQIFYMDPEDQVKESETFPDLAVAVDDDAQDAFLILVQQAVGGDEASEATQA